MQLALKPIQRSHSFDLSTSPSTPINLSHNHFNFKTNSYLLPVSNMTSDARTFSQNNLQAKTKCNLRSSFLQGSLEGLNQELQNLSVESSILIDHKSDSIPDGHRAPINELLCLFRDSPNNNNTYKNEFCNLAINGGNDNVTPNINNSGARLKVGKDKKICDLKLTVFPICDDISIIDDKIKTKSELDENTKSKSIQSNIDVDTKQHHAPSLSSPLPPIEPLSFNQKTFILPITQSTINTQCLEKNKTKTTSTIYNQIGNKDNTVYSTSNPNIQTTTRLNNTSHCKLVNNTTCHANNSILNRQLLIPSNQSAFTSVSKPTINLANLPSMTTSSLN